MQSFVDVFLVKVYEMRQISDMTFRDDRLWPPAVGDNGTANGIN